MSDRTSRVRAIFGAVVVALLWGVLVAGPARGTDETTATDGSTTTDPSTTDTTAADDGSTTTTNGSDPTSSTETSTTETSTTETTTTTTTTDPKALAGEPTAAPRKGELTPASLTPAADPNDPDGDGVLNGQDNCQFTWNPNQADVDGNNIGNRCDAFFGDQDGVSGSLYENRDCFNFVVPPGDDNSTQPSTQAFLPNALNFLGNQYTSLFVNNNGNVTFNAAQSEFTPFELTATTPPIIAPFFADVDTRSNLGRVFFGVSLHAPVFGGRSVFCATWEQVGYFSIHGDKTNTFQLLLVDRSDIAPGDFDIIFNYPHIGWETGDASGGANGIGGTSAGAGFSAGTGDPNAFLSLPCSLDNGGCLDTNFSTGLRNTSTDSLLKGRHVFPIRSGGSTFHGVIFGTAAIQVPNFLAINSLVEVCKLLPGNTAGGCRVATTTVDGKYEITNLPAGNYVVRSFPNRYGVTPKRNGKMPKTSPGPYQYSSVDGDPVPLALQGVPPPLDPLPVTVQVLNLGANEQRQVDLLSLGVAKAPPEGTTFGKPRGGTSMPHITQKKAAPFSIKVPCPGAIGAKVEVIRNGVVILLAPLTETVANNVSTYSAAINIPTSGPIEVKITIPGCINQTFDAYVDPSGNVVDQTGKPIEGATVILLRSDFAEGPFDFVPDGSPIMSPGNRLNPDETDADGHFGWDVISGFYKVDAVAPGCDAGHSPVIEIPPPVTDLVITLDCSAAVVTTTTTAPAVTGNELARTGTNAAHWADFAVGLIVAGAWMVVLAARVRRATVHR